MKWACLICSVLPLACAMDREELLEQKLCDPDGKCARGYRCQEGTCVADTRSNRAALRLADAGAETPGRGSSE